MSNNPYFAVCELEYVWPGAYVRCLGARDTMSEYYCEGGIYRVTEDLYIVGDDGGTWSGNYGSWELVNDNFIEKETAKVFDNPLVETKPYIVELDANPPEFDHISVEIGPYSSWGNDVNRIYLRIGGNGSVFENINKKGLGNLIKALSEVHDIMVEE